MIDQEGLVNRHGAAALLGCTPENVYRLVLTKALRPCHRKFRTGQSGRPGFRFRVEDVVRLIQQREARAQGVTA